MGTIRRGCNVVAACVVAYGGRVINHGRVEFKLWNNCFADRTWVEINAKEA